MPTGINRLRPAPFICNVMFYLQCCNQDLYLYLSKVWICISRMVINVWIFPYQLLWWYFHSNLTSLTDFSPHLIIFFLIFNKNVYNPIYIFILMFIIIEFFQSTHMQYIRHQFFRIYVLPWEKVFQLFTYSPNAENLSLIVDWLVNLFKFKYSL